MLQLYLLKWINNADWKKIGIYKCMLKLQILVF